MEDNLINQAVARKMLTSLGMSCEVASNGQDAVNAVLRMHLAGESSFDIILMDMSMPVMGGVEATEVCSMPVRFDVMQTDVFFAPLSAACRPRLVAVSSSWQLNRCVSRQR